MNGSILRLRGPLATLTLLGLLAGGASAQRTAGAARPNVLLILVDDLRPETGAYDKPYMVTPRLDRLAAEGVLFERAYVQQAVCAPSRNSLFTGLRPDSLRVHDLSTFFRTRLPGVVTMPQHFRQAGYRVEGMGKTFHTGHGNRDDSLSWSAFPAWRPKQIQPVDPQSGMKHPWVVAEEPEQAHSSWQLADHAIGRMQALRDSSFFLAVGFTLPHLPFVVPRKYWELYDPADIELPSPLPPRGATRYSLANFGELRKYHGIPQQGPLSAEQARSMVHGYRAAVSQVDSQVGRILDELDRLGLRDNTIVVLWGDHGWKLGEYGEWAKHTNFEVDTRIPLIVRAPGVRPARTRALAETIDLYPTLAELAGLPLAAGVQGSSLLPLLRDPGRPGKEAALSQYPRGEVMGYSLRTDRYRLVSWQRESDPRRTVARELYDHHRDPGETNNLALDPGYAATVRELEATLARVRGGDSPPRRGEPRRE